MFHQAHAPLESPLEKLQKEGGIKAITSILTSKPKQKHRSHVTWKTPEKGGHKQPKSPLDPDFVFGCNDDSLSDDSSDEEECSPEEKAQRKVARKHLYKVAIRNCTQHSSVCTEDKLLKRPPLPTTIFWNGKSGINLERFIDRFSGHITMQTHMGCILMDDIALLWLKHADPTVVLSMGLQRGIHPCLRHVSAKQFIEDVVWFFWSHETGHHRQRQEHHSTV